jgi:ATP-binding protein involved in chromosome partitioning
MPTPDLTSAQTALAALVDPTNGKPLSQRVATLSFAGGELALTMAGDVTAEERATIEQLIQSLIGCAPEVSKVSARWPRALHGRAQGESDTTKDIKHIILVMSGKGGVGKSTVASNLSLALRRLGYQVGLLDADMYGPSVPTMFGITGRPTTDGKRIRPLERFGLKLMSVGFLLEDPKSAVVWRGPMLHSALLQFVNDVDWGKLDFLIMDLPPGTGDVMLTLSQNIQASGAVVVTTPQEVALQDVYKSVSMAQKVNIPILGVVENESYFVCDKCDERHFIFGQGGGAKVAEQAGRPLLGQIPIRREIREWGDAGTPVVQASPGSEAARAFLAVAERVIEEAELLAEDSPTLTIDRGGGTNRHLPIAR